jgi:hypothetical protein
VNEVIDSVYYAEDTDEESFRSIMDQFSAESAIEADHYDGTWPVRYDGKVYIAELLLGGFDQNDRPVTPKQRTRSVITSVEPRNTRSPRGTRDQHTAEP